MKHSPYIVIFLILLLGCRETGTKNTTIPVSYELMPSKSEVFAGDSIQIQFRASVLDPTHLVVSNALGSAVLQPTLKNTELTFRFPEVFSQKAGVCRWTLVHNGAIYHKGEVIIHPNPQKGTVLESYLGPRSITAGNTDFSMYVVSPTDVYDNPLSDSTKIDHSYQFEDTVQETSIRLKNLIGWKNIYSTQKSGRILVTASCNDAYSKELTTIVSPANANDFQIAYKRNHSYADGNQIITFSTDAIQDEFENTVSDGTLVSFSVTNTKGMVLQTTGTTINGVARANLLHPTEAEIWKVTAYITGAAKSNTIAIDFEAALKDFNLSLSENGRILQIEEMQSFMEQWVPDGMPVKLKILDKNGVLLDTQRTTSKLGEAQFTISKDFYPNGSYALTIEVAGIVKRMNVILK